MTVSYCNIVTPSYNAAFLEIVSGAEILFVLFFFDIFMDEALLSLRWNARLQVTSQSVSSLSPVGTKISTCN